MLPPIRVILGIFSKSKSFGKTFGSLHSNVMYPVVWLYF